MNAPGNKPRKVIGRIVRILLVTVVVLIVSVVAVVNVSPKPFAMLVRHQFGVGIGVEPVIPALVGELGRNVQIEKDIEYPSSHASNRLDVFYPKDATAPLPTIIWVHGGGFVGGDKAGISAWATMIAAKGYTVITINYELAPENRYPGPIVQLGEVYAFLSSAGERFPTLDLHRLIIGGDSAGAQIASQFAALQTNTVLADRMQIPPSVPKEDLLAVVLYCGPYDLKRLYDSEGWFLRFFIRQIGWAYFDMHHWRDSPQAAQASTVENVTPDYPPTFLTDGNHLSFEQDARSLEAKLREYDVVVRSHYYPAEHGPIPHEYQFDLSIPEAMECYQRTLDFLTEVSTKKPASSDTY